MSETAIACASENTIAEFVEGRRRLADFPEVQAHIADCVECRGVLARVTLASLVGVRHASRPSGSPSGEGGDGEGGTLALEIVAEGRYEIGRAIARGGMGRILEAWDRRHQR